MTAHTFIHHGRPVSQKNSKEIVMVRGRPIIISNKKVKAWQKEAVRSFSEQWGGRDPVPRKTDCHVDIKAYVAPRQRPDVDNLACAPLDALQAAGVLENDSCVSWLRVTRAKVAEAEARIELTLWVGD